MAMDEKIALCVLASALIGIVLLLIGMYTGYTPCYFMEQMELSCH